MRTRPRANEHRIDADPPRVVPLFASIATFAALCDVHEKTIDRWLARGMPSIGSGRHRRVDVQLAVQWLRANERGAPARPADESTDPAALARRAAEQFLARRKGGS